jgi:hypothetical protein
LEHFTYYAIIAGWLSISLLAFVGFGTLDRILGYDSWAESWSETALASTGAALMVFMLSFWWIGAIILLLLALYLVGALVWFGLDRLFRS